jgi:hypothetical protein
MIEFLIAGADTKEYFRILKYIVYPVLKEDPLWHFFNEEEQGLIVRCSDEFQNILEETLGEHELSSSYTYWSKDHTIVMENWEYMKKIFHMNSEFAMENTLKYGPTCQFVDRIVHSLFNNLGYTVNNWDIEIESNILADCLISRAIYTGIRTQYKKMLEYRKEEDGKSSGESSQS